jgi:hypothetical protein
MQQQMLEKMSRYAAKQGVRALKIAGVSTGQLGTVTLTFDGGYFPPHDVSDDAVAKFMPAAGDYFMIWDDGREQCAPGHSFEEYFKPVT